MHHFQYFMEDPISDTDKQDNKWSIIAYSTSGGLPGDYMYTCNGVEICNVFLIISLWQK